MPDAIAVRIEQNLLKKIDSLRKETATDRSTIVRELIQRGYKDLLKERAAREYREGKITFSEAAHRAELTLWEMEHYLVDAGFKSQYSLDDLEKEMQFLG